MLYVSSPYTIYYHLIHENIMQLYIYNRYEPHHVKLLPSNRFERSLCINVILKSYLDLTVHIYYVIFELLSITPCETL